MSHSCEPEILDDGMTADDLVFALQHVNFHQGRCTLRLDRGVRDFLIEALRSKRTRAVQSCEKASSQNARPSRPVVGTAEADGLSIRAARIRPGQ
jgi:hypothetical protein